MFKSVKDKIIAFITSVTEKQIQPFSDELSVYKTKEQEYLCRIEFLEENMRNNNVQLNSIEKNVENFNARLEVLEENVRNNNAQLENMLSGNRLEALEENVRNNNAQLENILSSNRLEALEENVRNNNAQLENILSSNRLEALEENVRNNNAQLESILSNNRLDALEENVRNNNALLDMLQNLIKPGIFEAKIESVKSEVKRLKETITNSSEHIDGVITSKDSQSDVGDVYGDIDYFSFENYFRGSEDLIRKRQEIYLPYFERRKKVLDLGCGRGEFLEMLKEHGIDGIGVDFYEEFVIYCRNKGLNVEIGDAVLFLKQFSGTIDGIFAGQIVEHLRIEQIVALCRYAYDKLEKGSYLIMETPNPTSLSIYTNSFYMDPSHQKPVHPLTLKYFVEKAGFQDVQILYTDVSKPDESIPELESDIIDNLGEFNESMKKISNCLYGSQDYAIIARK